MLGSASLDREINRRPSAEARFDQAAPLFSARPDVDPSGLGAFSLVWVSLRGRMVGTPPGLGG